MTINLNTTMAMAITLSLGAATQVALAEEAPKQPGTAPGAARYNAANVAAPTPAMLSSINVNGGGKAPVKGTFSMPNLMTTPDIPVNFPVQVYPSNVSGKRFLATARGIKPQSANAHFETKDKIDVVWGWYKDFFRDKGWTYQAPKPEQSGKISKSGPIYMVEAQKDKQRSIVVCHTRKKDQVTTVTVNWVKE